MADTGILATTAQVQALVGANASTTFNAESYINTYVALAEGVVNTASAYNWCDAYATLNTDVKGILADTVGSYAAKKVINADPDAIGRTTAEFKINVLLDDFVRGINILKDLNARKFIDNA
jgi:hypothetical protein